MKKWIWILAALVVIPLGFVFLKFTMLTIPDDGMLPSFQQGDRVFMIKSKPENLKQGDIIAFRDPTLSDKSIGQRDKHLSRLIALPGDTLTIEKKEIFINGDLYNSEDPVFMKYRISTEKSFDQTVLSDFSYSDLQEIASGLVYELHCTPQTAAEIGRLEGVITVRLLWDLRGNSKPNTYPQSQFIAWNKDYFGPLVIPKAGMEVEINFKNYDLYKRILNVYEGHESYVNAQKVYIDGSPVTRYRFKKDYYFVINDNRDFPFDSRTFGPVPEDHIIGKK